jgi:pyochelin synthetase
VSVGGIEEPNSDEYNYHFLALDSRVPPLYIGSPQGPSPHAFGCAMHSELTDQSSAQTISQCEILQQAFFRRADRHSEAIAVICGSEQVSYGELAIRARHIAASLRDFGCQPQEIIAINAVRSVGTIAGLLGILEAGAAYLPIDPELPETRMQFVLADCGVRCAVAGPESVVAAQVSHIVDPAFSQFASNDLPSLSSRTTSQDLAYVIFTSGSTGTPKGVMITHAAAMNTIRDINCRFSVGEQDRVFALSSFAFDLSVYDVFGVLGAGGTIILPSDEEARDPAAWGRIVRDSRVTIWNSVPALMELLLSYLVASDQDLGRSLRLAMLSGDWISVSLPQRLWTVSPNMQIVSLGGATEASIWSIAYPIENVDPEWTSIPYGKPLVNQHFYVLNEQGEQCETNQVGELYIGGAGVALGYFNRPELTDERFVRDPWSAVPASRMYRTGDFGRIQPDGTIEFLGRIDNQIKINGHRIELAEVESRLVQCPEVGQCAVSAIGDSPENRRLVAHIVPKNRLIDKGKVRAYLRKHLPTSMVPSSIVAVRSLPMNANGKIDRTQLKTLFDSIPIAADGTAETLIDRLSAIWRDVLHLQHVGPHENFFDLGGDSLAAALLFIRLEREFENAPSLTDLMEHPTVADLAKLLGPHCAPKKGLVARLQPEGRRTPLFCLPGVDGRFLVFRELVEKLGRDQPVYGLEPYGLDGSDPDRSIEDIAGRHVRELRRLQPAGPYRLAGFSTGGVTAFEIARQLQRVGQRVSLLLLLDTYAGLPPSPSILGRASLHIRQLTSLPYREWPAHLKEQARIARVGIRGIISHKSPDERWADKLNLAANSARVALAHRQALSQYVLQRYSGKVVLFRATIQPRMWTVDEDLGWRQVCDSGLKVFPVHGTHADFLSSRHIAEIAPAIRMLLDEDRGKRTPQAHAEQSSHLIL